MKTQLHLTPADDGRPLSLEDFLSAGHEEGHRYELIGGRVEVSPIPDLPHDELVDWLKDALRAYTRVRPDVINKVKGPARVFLPVEDDRVTAPEPDIAAYRDYPTDGALADRDWRLVSPLLVVEVLSADGGDKDLVRNRELYLAVRSVHEYWILDQREDPDRPTLLVLRRRGARWGPTVTV
ncbi:MAG: Uma2 family endonuclease, partial [Gemmataceae bacterium]